MPSLPVLLSQDVRLNCEPVSSRYQHHQQRYQAHAIAVTDNERDFTGVEYINPLRGTSS